MFLKAKWDKIFLQKLFDKKKVNKFETYFNLVIKKFESYYFFKLVD